MKPVTIAEAREKLSELIDAALRGEEVTITLDD
ncbi:MAG: type II toxin-antitoxin system Phd/YefM family antitoxin [Halothece sp.]